MKPMIQLSVICLETVKRADDSEAVFRPLGYIQGTMNGEPFRLPSLNPGQFDKFIPGEVYTVLIGQEDDAA